MSTEVPDLDAYDTRILEELQRDARISMAELGRKVHLSQPAVTERVRKMEIAGFVKGYRAWWTTSGWATASAPGAGRARGIRAHAPADRADAGGGERLQRHRRGQLDPGDRGDRRRAPGRRGHQVLPAGGDLDLHRAEHAARARRRAARTAREHQARDPEGDRAVASSTPASAAAKASILHAAEPLAQHQHADQGRRHRQHGGEHAACAAGTTFSPVIQSHTVQTLAASA